MKHPAFCISLLTALLLAVPSCVGESEPGKTPENSTAGATSKTETGKSDPAKETPSKADTGTKDSSKTDPSKVAAQVPAKTKTAKKFTFKDKKKAKQQFQTFCASCHGTSGKGDGPAGLALNPKPRNWTDPAWQDSVTDEHIFNVMRDGGAKHGLSPLMPPNPEFADKPAVLHALVAVVRSFKGK